MLVADQELHGDTHLLPDELLPEELTAIISPGSTVEVLGGRRAGGAGRGQIHLCYLGGGCGGNGGGGGIEGAGVRGGGAGGEQCITLVQSIELHRAEDVASA